MRATKKNLNNQLPKGVLLCFLIVLFLSYPTIGYSQDGGDAKRRQAEAIYERIRIHFKNQNYPQVAVEMNDLFKLRLPGSDEDRVAQALTTVVANLIRVKQFGIAHQITDASLTQLTRPSNRSTAWIQKGKIFEAEGRNDDAFRAFKRAEDEAKRR